MIQEKIISSFIEKIQFQLPVARVRLEGQTSDGLSLAITLQGEHYPRFACAEFAEDLSDALSVEIAQSVLAERQIRHTPEPLAMAS